MNNQGENRKTVVGGYNRVNGGIEWTKRRQYDLTGNYHELRGKTWNPVGGCLHGCEWVMADGTKAECYAKTVAEGVASAVYPEGFESHYWYPDRLTEPKKLTDNGYRIFIDSMADLMGHWVPANQIEAVLDVCRHVNWHEYQVLTKNAPRLKKFTFPANVWIGVSSAPDVMFGNPLDWRQQLGYMRRGLGILADIQTGQPDPRRITWMSFEPLSWDVSEVVRQFPGALKWAVIGAASRGKAIYQPNPDHVNSLLAVLDRQGVPVFFKGNLRGLAGIGHWREDFPTESMFEPDQEYSYRT